MIKDYSVLLAVMGIILIGAVLINDPLNPSKEGDTIYHKDPHRVSIQQKCGINDDDLMSVAWEKIDKCIKGGN